MAKQLARSATITLKAAEVNRFQIPMICEETPTSGPRLTVHLNAMLRTEETATRRVPNPEYSADAAAAADLEQPYDIEPEVEESFVDVRDANLSNLEPEIFEGKELEALYAAGHENACTLIKQGASPGVAARRGLRDAMYTALEQRGRIPVE